MHARLRGRWLRRAAARFGAERTASTSCRARRNITIGGSSGSSVPIRHSERKGCAVARVGRGGQQDDPPGACRQGVGGPPAVAGAAPRCASSTTTRSQAVSSSARRTSGRFAKSIDVRWIPGSDQGLTSGGRSAAARRSQPASASSTARLESLRQLLAPLSPEAGGDQKEGAESDLACGQLQQDQSGLDGLAQADRVGDQHACDRRGGPSPAAAPAGVAGAGLTRAARRSRRRTVRPRRRPPDSVQTAAWMDRLRAATASQSQEADRTAPGGEHAP